jgi:hypothetical protein
MTISESKTLNWKIDNTSENLKIVWNKKFLTLEEVKFLIAITLTDANLTISKLLSLTEKLKNTEVAHLSMRGIGGIVGRYVDFVNQDKTIPIQNFISLLEALSKYEYNLDAHHVSGLTFISNFTSNSAEAKKILKDFKEKHKIK